jgi:isopentenyl-diphosphate Delta-isomerase
MFLRRPRTSQRGSEMSAPDPIAERKLDHLELALTDRARSGRDPGWDDVHLVPAPLPALSPGDVELRTDFVGAGLRAPVLLAPMTGGHPAAAEINAVLGEAAERLGLAVGVGSQRAALLDPSLAPTFAAVRRRAPSAVVVGNVGACQLVEQDGTEPFDADDLATIAEMVRADALSVHLNVVQELVQPEGDRQFTDLAAGIARAVHLSPVPVIAKETGAGMTADSAAALAAAGVAAIDVGGAGGTSFARIELARAERSGDDRGRRLGTVFADWGIPTATSVLETRHVGVPVVATGGVRTGLDAAKALALGADLVGVGRLAIEAARQGTAELVRRLEALLDELRTTMVLCGAQTPRALRSSLPVLTGFTLDWARQRQLLR